MRPVDIFLALLVQVLWGLNFVAVKTGLADFPPILLVTLRFGLVALLVVPFLRIPLNALRDVILLSFTLGTLHFALLFIGMADISAGTTGILIQLGVPFSALLGVILYREKLGPWRIGGLAVAFSGAALLAGGPDVPALAPALLLIISAFAWAVSNLLAKKTSTVNPVALSGWMSLFAFPQTALWSWLTEEGQMQAIASAGYQTWIALLYTAVASSIIAYGLWYWLLRRHPVSHVVPFSLLNPVVGMTVGVLLLGEDVTAWKVGGALLTLTGVGTILWRQALHANRKAEEIRTDPLPSVSPETKPSS